MPSAITLSEAATSRLRDLMVQSAEPILGLRISVKNSGCSGLAYAMELVTEQRKDEEMVEYNGIKIFLDPMAMMFLIGTELDYQQDRMGASFIFKNPNEKGRCGCGESFCV